MISYIYIDLFITQRFIQYEPTNFPASIWLVSSLNLVEHCTGIVEKPVALPDLYFHWSLWPVTSSVISARGIVRVVSSNV